MGRDKKPRTIEDALKSSEISKAKLTPQEMYAILCFCRYEIPADLVAELGQEYAPDSETLWTNQLRAGLKFMLSGIMHPDSCREASEAAGRVLEKWRKRPPKKV